VGGGIAAEQALRHLSERRLHTAAMQARLWGKLRASVPFVSLNGPDPGPKRISTNLNVSAEFTEGEGQLLSLDMAGIAVASGTSCVSKSMKVSPVLQAMGVERSLAEASVIFSFGKDGTEQEIDFAGVAYGKVIERLRGMSPLWDEFQRGVIDSVVQPRLALGVATRSSASLEGSL
jgi:cysteine desulfurase